MTKRECKKVQVWIYVRDALSGTQVLVLRTQPKRGNFWQPVTGHVEAGEEVSAGALREAVEETGLVFLTRPWPLEESFEFEARGLHVTEYGYAVEANKDALQPGGVKLDPHEHTEYSWVSPEEALKMVRFPSNADMLRKLSKILETKA